MINKTELLKEKFEEILEKGNIEDIKEFYDKVKSLYENKKEKIDEISIKTKEKIQEKPIESLGLALGTGALLGLGLGASITATKICNKKKEAKFEKLKNLHDYQYDIENKIKENPIQTIGITLGAGILLGTLLNNKRK